MCACVGGEGVGGQGEVGGIKEVNHSSRPEGGRVGVKGSKGVVTTRALKPHTIEQISYECAKN